MLSPVRRTARTVALGLTTTATVAAGALVAVPTGPATAAVAGRAEPTHRAAVAAGWLVDQLNRNDVIRSGYYDTTKDKFVRYVDHGLTLDVFFALKDLGVRKHKRGDILDALETRVDDYVIVGNQTYAQALAKLVTAVQRQHRKLRNYEDGDLLARLRATVHRDGDAEGLAEDAKAPGTTTTVGQSFAVRALAVAGSGLADEATRFLLKQQCDNGYFRVYTQSADRTCDGGTAAQSGPSVDTTAFAVQALLVARRQDVAVKHRRLVTALDAAERWLARRQRTSGAFGENGTANSNSTGLAAVALADLGREHRADRAAEWIRTVQVTRGLASDGALGGERGAIALGKAAFRAGKENGITREVRYEWRRATAQAAAGLDELRRG